MNGLLLRKAWGVLKRRVDAGLGAWLHDLDETLAAMAARPFELHMELTNLCNARCVFCPYQFQERAVETMGDEVFRKAVSDYVAIGGGSVGLTPIVGDALLDPSVLDRIRFLRSQEAIDRIFLTTNAILIDKFGAAELVRSGLDSVTISTASFDAENYRAIYRNAAYSRMRRNVLALLEENERAGRPVNIAIGFRTDRSLADVLEDPDFQEIRAFDPHLDFTWSFTSAGGRITREALPVGMRLRSVNRKREACVNLYNGPIVLPAGDVLGCSCVAAMDAIDDLRIGNVLEEGLGEIHRSHRMKALRSQFGEGGPALNTTCDGCDMYRDLELYRMREGRTRADVNRRRAAGELVRRTDRPEGAFQGG